MAYNEKYVIYLYFYIFGIIFYLCDRPQWVVMGFRRLPLSSVVFSLLCWLSLGNKTINNDFFNYILLFFTQGRFITERLLLRTANQISRFTHHLSKCRSRSRLLLSVCYTRLYIFTIYSIGASVDSVLVTKTTKKSPSGTKVTSPTSISSSSSRGRTSVGGGGAGDLPSYMKATTNSSQRKISER